MPYRKFHLALALIGVLVLGFIAASVISYHVAEDSLRDRIANETLPLTSDNVYSEIEQDLLRSVLIASLMAYDTFVRDWTLGGEDDHDSMIRYLDEIQDKYDTTTAFFVSEDSRRYYHPDGVLQRVEREESLDRWYFRVRDMNAPYEINVDTDTAEPDRLTIFVNHRVEGYHGNYIGATGIGLSVESVADLIESYERRYGRRIYFADRDGRITLHGEDFTGPKHLRERAGLRQAATGILTNPSTTTRYRAEDGSTVHLNARLLPELDWYLIVEASGSVAGSRILNTLLLNTGIALALAGLVGVTGWCTVRGYQARLEAMATRDELSGGANRQVFETLFDQAARLARRHRRPMSLIALDIDDFKTLNDTHGHAAGDTVIRALAATIREHIRDTDILCRWGGDEFLVLLGDCGQADARTIAEDTRQAVAARPIRHGRGELSVTLSLGVTACRHDEDLASVAGRADAALYEAKRSGRNRVYID